MSLFIQLLVKLAGAATEGLDERSDDDAINTEEKIWDLTQSINVKGVWFGCKHAIIAMREVRGYLTLGKLSFGCVSVEELTDLQNKADPSAGLGVGGSIINVASFVAIMGAATPQLACKSLSLMDVWWPTRVTRAAQIPRRRAPF